MYTVLFCDSVHCLLWNKHTILRDDDISNFINVIGVIFLSWFGVEPAVLDQSLGIKITCNWLSLNETIYMWTWTLIAMKVAAITIDAPPVFTVNSYKLYNKSVCLVVFWMRMIVFMTNFNVSYIYPGSN